MILVKISTFVINYNLRSDYDTTWWSYESWM